MDSPIFACRPENDLYRLMSGQTPGLRRVPDPGRAIREAPPGAGVLILADGYPEQTTRVQLAWFRQAAAKNVRLYVEYPAWLPELAVGVFPRTTEWERAVVASDAFGADLARHRIVAVHDCHFVPVEAETAHLVVARVAGFDTAVYGLPKQVFPLLFEHPAGNVLVGTTKLSHFVTGRYAPQDAWQAVWRYILEWLCPGQSLSVPTWTPAVHPAYAPAAVLPADLERAVDHDPSRKPCRGPSQTPWVWSQLSRRATCQSFELPLGVSVPSGSASR